MIGKGNVTCWSHVCVVYTIVTFACKAFFDFQSPTQNYFLWENLLKQLFCVASDQRKSWKKERQKRINAPNLQLCFQNQNSRRERGEKNSTFHKITAVKGSHFDLTSYNCNFPSLSFSPAFLSLLNCLYFRRGLSLKPLMSSSHSFWPEITFWCFLYVFLEGTYCSGR